MIPPIRMQVPGSLEPYVEGFWAELLARGYSVLSARSLIRVMAHLSRWLHGRHVRPQELTAPRIEQYLKARRRARFRAWISERGLAPLLGFLRRLQVVPAPRPRVARTARDRLLVRYGRTHRLLVIRSSKFGKSREVPLHDTTPSGLDLQDLDAPMIGAFLEDLENERHNGVRTRNARLAAIHSMFRYAALRAPNHAALIQRVLAIPNKRFEQAPVAFLDPSEVDALLSAPDGQSWIDRRDHALLIVAVQTGLRVSELIQLNRQDVQLGPGAHVRCQGKGRKERCTPLTSQTVAVLKTRLQKSPSLPSDPLFPNRRRGRLSRDAIEQLLKKYVAKAQANCPSLRGKRQGL